MSVSPDPAEGPVSVHGPTAIELADRRGFRYWIHKQFEFCDDDEVNDYLSGFPIAVFVPERHGQRTPVVFALHDFGAPYAWNAAIVPALLDMGIACVLVETPLAGERSLVRTHRGEAASELAALTQRDVRLDSALLARTFDCVARDLELARREVSTCHLGAGEEGARVAVLGVRAGAALAAHAFINCGFGDALLCVAGHCDLQHLARGLAAQAVPGFTSVPFGDLAQDLLNKHGGAIDGWVQALRLADAIALGSDEGDAKPLPRELDLAASAPLVGKNRIVRIIVGKEDAGVKEADAVACASLFADGECFVVPGMGHEFVPKFWEHVQYFLKTQLASWSQQS